MSRCHCTTLRPLADSAGHAQGAQVGEAAQANAAAFAEFTDDVKSKVPRGAIVNNASGARVD